VAGAVSDLVVGGPSAPAGFRVDAESDALVLTGEVDSFAAAALTDALTAAPSSGSTVTLDAAGLLFIDAAGTRAIAAWRDALRADGVELVVRNAPRGLRRVWDALGFGRPPFA
jgi:anti-anti-sigma factor